MNKLKPAGKHRPVYKSYLKILLLFSFFTVFTITSAVAQTTYTFSFKQANLNNVIAEIATKTNYQFVYDASFNQKAKPINAEIKSADINEILTQVFKNQDFTYRVNGKTIVIKSKSPGENTYTLHGMINDDNGLKMPGVTVTQKGTKNMVHTDNNGHFGIDVSDSNNTLIFSYLGYETKEIKYSKGATGSVIIVSLAPSNSILNEVVVTGYQTLKKVESPAAITAITEKVLNENVNVDLTSALEGRVAGLLHQKNVNGIGADKTILRGVGTFSVNEVGVEPLLVIDGLPTEIALSDINPYDVESINVLKDASAASIYGSRAANGIIVINTKKGNGNLKINFNSDFFISTKPNLNDMHYASTSDLIDFEQAVYTRERARYTSSALMFNSYGDIGNSSMKYYSPLYQLNRDLENGKINSNDYNSTLNQWRQNDYYKDYTDNVWQNEFRQRYNISLSGGTAKQNTYVSFNFDDAKQRIKNNQSQNFTLYAKSSFQIKSWLNATVGINGAYSFADITDGAYDNYDIQKRYERITDENGNLVISPFVGISDDFTSSGTINPAVAAKINSLTGFKPVTFNVLEQLDEGITKQNNLSLRTFANIDAKIWRGLSFSTQFQYENRRTNAEVYHDINSYQMRYAINTLTGYNPTTSAYTYVDGFSTGGRYRQANSQSSNYTFRNQLNFDQAFDNYKHKITAIAGFEMRETFSPRSVDQLRYGYDPVTLTSSIYNTLALSQGVPSYIFGNNRSLGALNRNQYETKHRNFSAYSNVGYTYLAKYNVMGSIRVDRADFFGAEPKYRNRPLWSIGLGWNASNEEFLKNVNWVDFLKLRATYGVNGNVDQSTTPYTVATRRNDNLFQSLQYINITQQPNPYLRWEKTASTNIGLDYGLFKNKLRGSIDIYNKVSSDLLATTDLDPTVGATSRRINAGALTNRGIEFSVGSEWLNKGDFRINSNFIIAFNRTKVDKVTMAKGNANYYVSSPSNYFFNGEYYNSLYAYRFGGITNGYPYILDENGNPSLTFDADGNPLSTSVKTVNNADALINMGSLTPTYTGSLSQRFSYKQLDLNMLFVFSGGNKMRKDIMDLGSDALTNRAITQRYTTANPNNNTRLWVDFAENMRNYASTISSQYRNADVNVVDGDYIKLRNVSLSYTLPKTFANKARISSAKLTFQMNNIWYWSAAGNDIDPEVYSANAGTRNIPLPKTYLFGFNLTL
ncbi:MAG: SusC/RagA family TonB-linked outer membrane protein [Flavobacteriales bacterium]|nr:MAG: SusC/RagA family TonB-linked outer membrane protein [Flavobacteriales bacterium]